MAFDKEAYWNKRAAEKADSAAREGQSRDRQTKQFQRKLQLPPNTLVCGPCMEHPETKAKAWRGPFKKLPVGEGLYHDGCPWTATHGRPA